MVALGAKNLARHFNVEEEAAQVNGLEVAYHDPRGASGMGLVYATSPRGACHNQSDYFLVEIGQADAEIGLEMLDRLGGSEKALNVARHKDFRTVFNSLVMCYFSNIPVQTLVSLINTSCGLEWDVREMMKSGERGWNIKRLINIRLGVGRSSDVLPKVFSKPYVHEGPGTGGFVPDMDAMLSAYYLARGWDKESGFPTERKLEALGLGWVKEYLPLDGPAGRNREYE